MLGSAFLALAAAPSPDGRHRLGPAAAHAQDASRPGVEHAGGRQEAPKRIEGESRRIDTTFYGLRLTAYHLGKPAGPLDSNKGKAVFRLKMQDRRDRSTMSLTERIAQTVLRLRNHGRRVVYAEKIGLRNRLRDVTETPNGEIWPSTDSLRMLRLRPARTRTLTEKAQAGKELYDDLCAECHSKERNGPHGIGPNLYNLLGQRIARIAGYDYSPALRARSSERWTPDNLHAFMKDPEAFAPGTKMQFQVPYHKQRDRLLKYLTVR